VTFHPAPEGDRKRKTLESGADFVNDVVVVIAARRSEPFFQVSIAGAVDCSLVVAVEDWMEVRMNFNLEELAEF
jgi:hypothetical protein